MAKYLSRFYDTFLGILSFTNLEFCGILCGSLFLFPSSNWRLHWGTCAEKVQLLADRSGQRQRVSKAKWDTEERVIMKRHKDVERGTSMYFKGFWIWGVYHCIIVVEIKPRESSWSVQLDVDQWPTWTYLLLFSGMPWHQRSFAGKADQAGMCAGAGAKMSTKDWISPHCRDENDLTLCTLWISLP